MDTSNPLLFNSERVSIDNIKDIHFFIKNFKTSLCNNANSHQLQTCFYYHDLYDKRRPPYSGIQLAYKQQLCKQFSCNASVFLIEQDCKLCTNKYEYNYHPINYKKYHCSNIICNNIQILCPYSHEIQDQQFNINTFKTNQCRKKDFHDLKRCHFYHDIKDRRRNLLIYTYSHQQCINKNNCFQNDLCNYAHNKVQQLYHKTRYKSKFCQKEKCQYGIYCSFAHNEQQITIQLIEKMQRNDKFYMFYYKTVWCPYTLKHDRSQCIYAHNVQDWRRDPKVYKYNAIYCKNWKTKSDKIKSYQDGGCSMLVNCTFCHGWKEFKFHPDLYLKKDKKSVYKNDTKITFENKIESVKIGCPFFTKKEENQSTEQSINSRNNSLDSFNESSKNKNKKKTQKEGTQIFEMYYKQEQKQVVDFDSFDDFDDLNKEIFNKNCQN